MNANILFIISFLIFFPYIFGIEVHAEQKTVIIPFGAYNPELNTPAEVWFDPPTISIKVGDSVSWINDDREGHTVTSGQGSGRFGWMSDDYGQAVEMRVMMFS